MRIGFDASILAPQTLRSGTGRYALRLLQHLDETLPDAGFVLFGLPGAERPDGIPARFVWEPLPRVRLGKLSTLAVYQRELPRIAREMAVDLLHVPAVHPRPTWPSLPRGLPCPMVVTVHDLIPLTFYSHIHKLPLRQQLFYRWNLRALRKAACVITVSEASKREIASNTSVPPERVQVVHNGVDHPGEAGAVDEQSDPHILFVGSFEPRKNLALLVRAYGSAALRLPLVAVADPGSGDQGPVRRALAATGTGGSVEFRRAESDTELSRLYRGALFAVCPSLAEGFGLPPLEAMSHGTPVIASSIPAHREVLGDAALFFEANDERGLAERMTQLAFDADLRHRLADRGRGRARLFSWRDCALGTAAVYEQVLTARRRYPAVAAGPSASAPAEERVQ